MTEWLCCTPETYMILQINHTSIKKFLKRNMKISDSDQHYAENPSGCFELGSSRK